MEKENKNVDLECETTPWWVWVFVAMWVLILISFGFEIRGFLNTVSSIEVKCESGYSITLSLKNGEESYIECPNAKVQPKQWEWEVVDNTGLLKNNSNLFSDEQWARECEVWHYKNCPKKETEPNFWSSSYMPFNLRIGGEDF